MPKAALKTRGPKPSTTRTKPYLKPSPSKSDKENSDPASPPSFDSSITIDQSDYRAISLEEIKGEVPCYDDAAVVRRKLKKLLAEKSTIPGTDKKWSQASMAAEMQELENRSHAVEYNRNASGPSINSLAGFLKKSGKLGGGDSPCYYWGYVMLEKLRVHNGEKKSKARVKAEEEIPSGHIRIDPSTRRFWCGPGCPPPSMQELVHASR